MSETVLTVRMDSDFSEAFGVACRAESVTKAQKTRDLIAGFLARDKQVREDTLQIFLDLQESKIIVEALRAYLVKNPSSEGMGLFYYLAQESKELEISLNKQLDFISL